MPELPEVESARHVVATRALGRLIADVDDRDTYECRPHEPGEIRSALVGRELTATHRRGDRQPPGRRGAVAEQPERAAVGGRTTWWCPVEQT